MEEKRFFVYVLFLLAFLFAGACAGTGESRDPSSGSDRPNILFAFADDWGAHAGAYGTKGIETPNFDRVAKQGVRFTNAYVASPSCTPSRGAVLTGQYIWRLGPGANLHSTLPEDLPVYPFQIQKKTDYHVGYSRKGWGPGNVQKGGRDQNPAGPKFQNFTQFLESRPENQPFCFWFGSSDPHRDYDDRLRKAYEVEPESVEVPPYLPDAPSVRKDIANYYAEVMRFDREVGRLLETLKKRGELQNTLVVISGDHGWPFPRGKSNLYDMGTRVPMAVMWPGEVPEDRVVTDFVNLTDLAPTFLRAAGVTPPEQMTGQSLLPLLRSENEGRVESDRSYVVMGKERHHGLCRAGGVGYPMRAIRTDDYLYIWNFKPDRWPAGSPYLSSSQGIFSDCDDGPTKNYMIDHANDPNVRSLFRQAFDKRPREELYDVNNDPHQLNNLASDEAHQDVKRRLSQKLDERLRATGDPRIRGEGEKFDQHPYYTGYGNKSVEPPESVKKALNLSSGEKK